MTRFAVSAVLAAVLTILSNLHAQETETITSFDVRIEIDPEDASLFVTETITVTVSGDKIRHGIYRDFPTLNKAPFGLRKPADFEIISVLRNGDPERFAIEGFRQGKRLRIGDPEKKIPHGTQTYTIDYRTTGQLRTFSAHDELYWNATGHDWEFPMVLARVTVVLPQGAEVINNDNLRPAAYLGEPGSGEDPEDYRYTQQREHTAIFQSLRTIHPGEGLTVSVPFTKGTVVHPPTDSAAFFKTNWPTLLGVLLVAAGLLFHVGAWFAVGRDPSPGQIHTLPEPPENFSPAACRYLERMGFDDRCFSAAIVSLASKNALKITGDADTAFVLRHPDPTLQKAPLTKDEAALAANLLQNREHIALEPSNHRQVAAARDCLEAELARLLEKTHFVHNIHLWVPGLVATLLGTGLSLFNSSMPPVAFFLAFWLTGWTVGCAFLLSSTLGAYRAKRWGSALRFTLFSIPFLAFWVAALWGLNDIASPTSIVLLVVGAAANVLFYGLIKAPTHAGRDVLDDIEGFEKFLDATASDEPGSSALSADSFSRYLPYAIALDREQKWGDRFSSLLADAARDGSSSATFHHPHWYAGSMAASGFGSAIGSALTTSLSSSAQSPSNSSGSSGGGSSGGGGGGGGGGGW